MSFSHDLGNSPPRLGILILGFLGVIMLCTTNGNFQVDEEVWM